MIREEVGRNSAIPAKERLTVPTSNINWKNSGKKYEPRKQQRKRWKLLLRAAWQTSGILEVQKWMADDEVRVEPRGRHLTKESRV